MNASKTRFSSFRMRKKKTSDRTAAHRERRHVRAQVARVNPAEDRRRALLRAIDSDVRAVGRIVVCVDADADVSTAMISSLSSPRAEDALAQRGEDVVGVVDQELGPARRPAPRW